MNAIVLVALKRPLTFVVLAILIVLFGGLAVLRTPTDIFPNIGIPVIAVVWSYSGLTPADMSGRVVYYFERNHHHHRVRHRAHRELSRSTACGIVKVYFQQGTNISAAAQAQIAASGQTVLKQMPTGITPPNDAGLQRLLGAGDGRAGLGHHRDRGAAQRPTPPTSDPSGAR